MKLKGVCQLKMRFSSYYKNPGLVFLSVKVIEMSGDESEDCEQQANNTNWPIIIRITCPLITRHATDTINSLSNYQVLSDYLTLLSEIGAAETKSI